MSIHTASSDDGIFAMAGTHYKLNVTQMHDVEELVVERKPSIGVRHFELHVGRELAVIVQICNEVSVGEHSRRDNHRQMSTPVNFT
jgi:hypothetical protein